MSSQFITTKVRPVQKLFIIEQHDIKAFLRIFSVLQNDIDAPFNPILVNDEDLWTECTQAFVMRSNPDIILNLSQADDDRLSRHFEVFSIKPVTDQYKMERFICPLSSFTRLPAFVEKLNKEESLPGEYQLYSATKLEETPESLFVAINFGYFDENLPETLGISIFKKVTPEYIDVDEAATKLFEHDTKFAYITTSLGGFNGSGYGESIWEINYNKEGHFKSDKRYFFVSSVSDTRAISYFWNTRSYYAYSKCVWVPYELLDNIRLPVENDSVFVCFDPKIKQDLQQRYSDNPFIEPTRLYFEGRNTRWNHLEYTQAITVTNNTVNIVHPVSKTFADFGIAHICVVEMRGLKEFLYPKRHNLGKLFINKSEREHYPLFAERFTNINEVGLAKYYLDFSPFQLDDIFLEIRLPLFAEVLEHFFEDAGYKIQSTVKTQVLEQTINLFGGASQLNVLTNEDLFNLLVKLTPKERTEKITQSLQPLLQVTPEDILLLISEIRESGAINFPPVILTLDEMLASIPGKRGEKAPLMTHLQNLYNQRILLRGKNFECEHCKTNLWIEIEAIERINYCTACSNEIHIPISGKTKEASDYFRLNQLVVRAVDQGQLSTMLLIHLLSIQNYRALEYKTNFEILKDEKVFTDVDLFVRTGRRIGVIECKSSAGFTQKQVDDLVIIGQKLKCNFIAFSCLLGSNHSEIKNLETMLLKHQLEIPAFIFTKEILFAPRPRIIEGYFEVSRRSEFITGPVLFK
jgi:hypothetical protein